MFYTSCRAPLQLVFLCLLQIRKHRINQHLLTEAFDTSLKYVMLKPRYANIRISDNHIDNE